MLPREYSPVDDTAAAAAGPWMNDFTKGNMKPAFFRNPVHCVKISREGLLYVCDRGNNRLQVFNGRDPNLGKECGLGFHRCADLPPRLGQASEGGDHVAQPSADVRRVEPHDRRSAAT
jgi:hypothetical protein